MKIRREYLEKGRGISDSQMLPINVDVQDAISAITIIYEANNGATSNQGVYLHDDVDSIDLVDGAREIYSLDGLETLILNCFELGHFPYGLLTEAAAASQYEVFTILFGRFIGDHAYWLDPADFKNLQLKLTHSLTISGTAGFATGTGSIDVIAHLFHDKPASRKGYFTTKEAYKFTSVASGDEKINLPTDYPYRMLIQRAFETAIGINTDITNIKVNCDGGGFVPLNMDMLDIVQLNAEQFGKFEIAYDLLRTDADVVSVHVHDVREFFLNAVNDLDLGSIDARTIDQLTVQLISVTAVPAIAKSAADTQLVLKVGGYAPFGSVLIPITNPQDEDTFFHAPDYDNIKLELTQGAAGATCQTILQQIIS
jgi:hypothetical protein